MIRLAAVVIAIGGLVQTTTIAHADARYQNCISQSDSTNAAWSACGVDYLDRLDATLNETWQTVFPQLTNQGQVSLRAEQRAWNTFKELSCLHLANGDFGREGQVLDFPACRAEIIAQRIDYLDALREFVGPR